VPARSIGSGSRPSWRESDAFTCVIRPPAPAAAFLSNRVELAHLGDRALRAAGIAPG
jgi:hypothetical protein